MARTNVNSELYTVPVAGWTQAVRVSPDHDLIFVSGVTARDSSGRVVEGDFEAQARRVLDNLQNILGEAGATLADVIQMRWLTLSFDKFDQLHDLRLEYFGQPLPTSTGVGVTGFVDKHALIEIEVIAAVPRSAGSNDNAGS